MGPRICVWMAERRKIHENIFFKKKNELTVDKMELLTQLDWLERPPMGEEIETIEEEDNTEPQIWKDFEDTTERFRKSLYYGRIPSSDRFSLPVTELCVANFNHLGLEGLEKKLDRLSIDRAAEITRETCSSPTSLVLALLYLDRLRSSNPKYLSNISSTDLFLVSLMVASKFLHDDGEEDEVFNDEWASSAGIDTKELNKLEVKFLAAMDWRIFVDNAEFQSTLCRLEADIALREVSARDGDATYSDLEVLGSGEQAAHLLSLLVQAAIKVTAVCLTTYAAGLLTLLGTAAALSRTPLGPAQVSHSVRTLASVFNGLDEQDVVVHPLADDNATRDEVRALSHADLVTASLLVTTLTSAPLTGDALNDEEERRSRTGSSS